MNTTAPVQGENKTALALMFAINYYINLGHTYEEIRKQFKISWGQVQTARSVWIDYFPNSTLRQALNRLPLRLSDAFVHFAARSQNRMLAYRTFQDHLNTYGGPNWTESEVSALDLTTAQQIAEAGKPTRRFAYALLLQVPIDQAGDDRVEFFLGKCIRESGRTYSRRYLGSLNDYIDWLLEAKPFDLKLE